MDHRVDFAPVQGLLELLSRAVPPDTGGLHAVVGQVLVEIVLAHISFHHAEGNMLHGLKVLIGQVAVPSGGDHAKGIAAGQVRVLIAGSPLGRVLRGAHQVGLFLRHQLERLIPAGTLHELNLPVGVPAQGLQVFHVHTGIFAVFFFLVVALHWKKRDLYRPPVLGKGCTGENFQKQAHRQYKTKKRCQSLPQNSLFHSDTP